MIKFVVETYLRKPDWRYDPYSGDGFIVVFPTTNSDYGHYPFAKLNVEGHADGLRPYIGHRVLRRMMEIEPEEIHDSPACVLSKKEYKMQEFRFRYLEELTTEMLKAYYRK